MSPRKILTLVTPHLPPLLTATVYNDTKRHTRDFWIAPKHDPDRVLRLSVTQIDKSRVVARCGASALEIALHAQPNAERLAKWVQDAIAQHKP